MKYYEVRLENDLAGIRTAAKDMGERVQEAVKGAVHALLTGNRHLSYQTIQNDGYIKRNMRRINHLCHTFVARQMQLRKPPQGAIAREIDLRQAMRLQALSAFEQEMADPAKGTVIMAVQIEHSFRYIFSDLFDQGGRDGGIAQHGGPLI